MIVTGIGTIVGAPAGGHAINLAAISAALAAGPEAGEDRDRRWIAGVTAGVGYAVLGVGSAAFGAVVLLAPAGVVPAVAGLALVATFVLAISQAIEEPGERIPAAATFLVAASGIAVAGVSAAFWRSSSGSSSGRCSSRSASARLRPRRPATTIDGCSRVSPGCSSARSREDPADAEVDSHRLLVRAGYIRRQAPGVFAWLPLGLKVRGRIEQVIREEMAAAGAQEVHFPALLPREPYEATGRWTEYGDGIFRLQDRKGADYLLAPTHEEVFTLLVKDLYSSYKDLPLTIYQIQDKYRDERGPGPGLLRGREFSMKDAYSFDVDDAGLDASYQAPARRVRADLPATRPRLRHRERPRRAMGGSKSEEFLLPVEIGEDKFVRSAAGLAANVEAFRALAPEARPIEGSLPRSCTTRPTPHDPDPRRRRERRAPARGRPRLDRRGHVEERRARDRLADRRARARHRRAAGRSRGRPQACRGGVLAE